MKKMARISTQARISLMLSIPLCCRHRFQFSTDAANTHSPQLKFEDILREENKLRSQKKLKHEIPVRTSKEYPLKPGHSDAAVLVPLCLVRGEPSLLLTLRSSNLRIHRGQVSFPGGNVDKTDADYIQTALRETREELGIDMESFDVWGQLNPMPGSDGRKIVYPILASTGEVDVTKLQINHDEVQEAFCVSLRHLCDPANVGSTRFREGLGYTLPVYTGVAHRIWGLTAVIIHQVLNIIAPGLYSFKIRHKIPAFEQSSSSKKVKH